jgi:D-glycero-alpha-D-manno-heptose 1-phosphate guanylyltransferase
VSLYSTPPKNETGQTGKKVIQKKNMQTLILAGGLGTRLRTVIEDRPKPLAPVADRPFLEYLILQVKNQGFIDIVLCIGYLGEQIQNYFGDGNRWGVQISYSQEKELLGTGGAIKLAQRVIKEDNLLVMNGDSFLQVDLNKLITYHLKKEAQATIALVEADDSTRYGAVEINEEGEIENFVEKGERSRLNLINGGVYLLNRKVFDDIPEGKTSLEREVFPRLIGKGFYGMPVKGFFIDIGVVEEYQRLQSQSDVLLKGR